LWLPALTRWRERNADKKTNVDNEPAPDRNDEYLLYQTLLGAWPFEPTEDERRMTNDETSKPSSFVLGPSSGFVERIQAYMEKATKEAKVHTSWVNPNAGYDAAVRTFVSGILADQGFLGDLGVLLRPVAYYGQFNALAQTLLKLTSPGVPDIYQGAELWDLSLVDPDNRRPVDFVLRRALLAALKDRIEQAGDDLRPLARELLETSQDGRIKLYLTERVLAFRRAHADLFAQGAYLPLGAQGSKHEHVCAFARVHRGKSAIVVAPRLVAKLAEGAERPPIDEEVWRDTWLELPDAPANARYRNILTGETLIAQARGLRLAAIFSSLPVCLLVRQ
jgi:(1->4)-alpha-D-glucan 1-alpha-D-glucosylmutase